MVTLWLTLGKKFNTTPFPGIIRFHHYVPISELLIGVKHTNEDQQMQIFNHLTGTSPTY